MWNLVDEVVDGDNTYHPQAISMFLNTSPAQTNCYLQYNVFALEGEGGGEESEILNQVSTEG